MHGVSVHRNSIAPWLLPAVLAFEPKKKLWDVGHVAAARVDEIVRRFVELGKQNGFSPVLVFLPELEELAGYNDGKPAYYAQFLQSFARRYPSQDLILVDVYEENFDPYEFSPPGCHPSAYGHEVIATAVFNDTRALVEALRH